MRSGPRPRRRVPLALLTTVVLVAAVGLAAVWLVLGGTLDSQRQQRQARDQAVTAASRTAVDLNSYAYATIDRQFGVIQGELTGPSLAEFVKAKAGLKSGFVRSKINTRARALASGVVSSDRTAASVLVSLYVIYNVNGKATARQSPLQIHVVKHGSRWLVDQITTVA